MTSGEIGGTERRALQLVEDKLALGSSCTSAKTAEASRTVTRPLRRGDGCGGDRRLAVVLGERVEARLDDGSGEPRSPAYLGVMSRAARSMGRASTW